MVQGIEVPVATIWKNMLGSLLMGIYFGSASLIYNIESWSPLKQTTIHFVTSITIWIPLAITFGWIPIDTVSILIAFGGFVVTYFIFWFGARLYFKMLTNEMNNSIRKK